VHGTTADHTAWDAVRAELESACTVYAMDRRGRGGSGDAPTYAAEREFEDVAAVVDQLGAAVPVLAHSWGAVCALEAARLTRNIARLVLYEPNVISTRSGETPYRLADELDELIAHDRRDEALGRFYQEVLGMSAEVLEQQRATPAWASRVAAAHTIPREMRAVEVTYRFGPESRAGAVVDRSGAVQASDCRRCGPEAVPRFQSPLINPCTTFSITRLSEILHRAAVGVAVYHLTVPVS